MGYGVRVLARPEVGSGFALAGLPTVPAASATQARECLQELLAMPDVGVVLIEEGWYEGLPDPVRRQLGRRPLPMVVPFPGPAWAQERETAEQYIVELLRQVIGYRVRLK
jgi:vacuolar-type H+-ATPase subunit F/Vma7